MKKKSNGMGLIAACAAADEMVKNVVLCRSVEAGGVVFAKNVL